MKEIKQPKDFPIKAKQLAETTYEAMNKMGGIINIRELDDEIANILNISDELLSIPWKANGTIFRYNCAWARTYLKKQGLIKNESRGLWRIVGSEDGEITKPTINIKEKEIIADEVLEELSDIDLMLNHLIQVNPFVFENLCKQLLVKMKFKNVIVTQQSNDKGIDGYAILEHNPVISMKFAFQAKRYNRKNPITSSVIRDFRGSIVNRAEKGVIFTTGFATKAAKEEVLSSPRNDIKIIEGPELAELFIKHEIGVQVKRELSFISK